MTKLPRPTPTPPLTKGASDKTCATVRLYCQGIGDCHLLRFEKQKGGYFWILIDCGVHSAVQGGPDKINAIVDDIAVCIKPYTRIIDVLVLTHEHWDHNSGFVSAAKKFSKEGGGGIEIGEVWLGWTENPADPQARQLDKFKTDALEALGGARQRLAGLQSPSPYLATIQKGLAGVLGFFGLKGERVRDARNAAIDLVAKDHVRYFEPTTPPVNFPDLARPLRIYVLGPPRNAAMLGITERASETYGVAGGTPRWPIARALRAALNSNPDPTDNSRASAAVDDNSAPFDPTEGFRFDTLGVDAKSDKKAEKILAFMEEHYFGPARSSTSETGRKGAVSPSPAETDQSWRRIDHDWLGVSADLAIQLDDRTNNSSLVLAFEFIDTERVMDMGRVMLFVGDAQVGNWLSWKDVSWKIGDRTVTGPDLLKHTVFYKVGHHGSHNATLKRYGLEEMTHPDLSAFIPTNEKDALRVKWGQMPFAPLLDNLKVRTSDRVIRADDDWIAKAAGPPAELRSGAIRDVRGDPKKLWVELDIG